MIILDSNTKSLQIALGGAVANNQLPFTACYIDKSGVSSSLGASQGITNNATPVSLVAAPASGMQRQVESLTVQNADTGSVKASIICNDNGVTRSLFIATLSPGDNLVYEDGRGFSIFDSTGALKQSVVTISALPGGRKPQVVAAGCSLHNSVWGNGAGGRSDTRVDNREAYTLAGNQPVSHIQIAAMGFYLNANGEITFTTDLSYEAALELTSPVTYQRAHVANAAIGTIPTGIPYVLSTPVAFDFPAGGSFFLRHSYSVPNTSSTFPAGSLQGPSGSAGYVSAQANSQVPGTGAYSSPGGGASFGGPKTMVIGVPAAAMPAVAFVGDSIADGNNDSVDTNGNIGFVMRGLWNVNGHPIASLKQTVGSWTFSKCTLDTSPRLRDFWPFVTHLLIQLGTNDIANATTLSALQTYVNNLLTAAKRTIGPYGKPLQTAACTIVPRVSSTDSYATPGNQTPLSGFAAGGVRDQYNAWLKTQVGNGLLDAVIDVNPYAEDQANPGKWVTNGSANYATSDGVHPSTAIHILMAQAVNSWAQSLNP